MSGRRRCGSSALMNGRWTISDRPPHIRLMISAYSRTVRSSGLPRLNTSPVVPSVSCARTIPSTRSET